MNQRLPIFEELHDARSHPDVARVLLTIPLSLMMTYQDAIRRICHCRHFPAGADYVDQICTLLRATRQATGLMADRADDLLLAANEQMLKVIAEAGEGVE